MELRKRYEIRKKTLDETLSYEVEVRIYRDRFPSDYSFKKYFEDFEKGLALNSNKKESESKPEMRQTTYYFRNGAKISFRYYTSHGDYADLLVECGNNEVDNVINAIIL